MRWLRFSLLVLFVAVLQASMAMNVVAITQMRISPDLLLILLVYLAIKCDSYDAIITSFALGLAVDIISPSMGPYFLSFGIIGTGLAHVRKIILLKRTQQQAATIFIVGVIAGCVAKILAGLTGTTSPVNSVFAIFAASAYSAIVYFLIKWFVDAAARWMGIGVHRFGVHSGT